MELDVNYLLLRQQVSLAHAGKSRSHEGRTAYENLAKGYTDRIDAYRLENVKRLRHAG